MEIEWAAEFVSSFDGYLQLSSVDKVAIFKNYWILFVILERSFDSYRVLGPSMQDMRMVFANGTIMDVMRCPYDLKHVTDKERCEDVIGLPQSPWFKQSAKEILAPLKRLEPSEVEMMFCLALMFWNVPYEVAVQINPQSFDLAHRMMAALYKELNDYYVSEMPEVNQVQRVAELMRMISIAEKIAAQRKEDIILSKTFKSLKIDLFMEDIFETV